MLKIKRALFSVHDKTGLFDLATACASSGVEIIATGGTARFLADQGVAITPLEDLTRFPEILDGRVKTLHPHVFGGLLARRDSAAHLEQLATHGMALIDMVVVNLYPFRTVAAHPDTALAEALENIDIGGVALIRAGAKNFPHVAVLVSPAQYGEAIAEMQQNGGGLSAATRRKLAGVAFAHTAAYDAAIHAYLREDKQTALPETMIIALNKLQDLRYGENPHQRAAFYRDDFTGERGFAGVQPLQGKEISYNNLADADAALQIVRRFSQPCCAIIKHANPCGIAIAGSLAEAYHKAKATDPVAAFGGIVGCNHEVDAATAMQIAELFTEVVVAPAFSAEALRRFSAKKNLRLLQIPEVAHAAPAGLDFKNIAGGLLVQDRDLAMEAEHDFRTVTQRAPSAAEMAALWFGWQAVRWVKSNAIVFCGADRTLGVGAGQMSRIDAVALAVEKARNTGLSLASAAMASDAFLPFPDSMEAAAAAGATAVVQPGGAMRDAEIIAAADRLGLAMVFTGVRHFRH